METDTRQPVKIAVIGAGSIGPRHAQAVRSSPDAKLTCIVDPSRNAIQTAIRLGATYYPTVKAMLASPIKRPDAAIVCTPNHAHAAVATELLAAGVHVLCEKPLCTDAESGRELVGLAEEAASKGEGAPRLLTGHHRRFNPYVAATKRILASEEHSIGRVTAVSGLWTMLKPDDYFDPPADWRKAADTGGPVLINLIHDVDVLHYLLDSRVKRVAAFEGQKRRGHAAEETGAILLHFENGVVATFVLSDAVVSPHAFESGTGENPIIPKTGRDFYRILGTEGTLSVPDLRRSFYKAGDARSWSSEITEVTEKLEDWISEEERTKVPFELQVAHLIRVVRGEEQPFCTGEDGLAAVKVALAVKKALQTGQTIEV